MLAAPPKRASSGLYMNISRPRRFINRSGLGKQRNLCEAKRIGRLITLHSMTIRRISKYLPKTSLEKYLIEHRKSTWLTFESKFLELQKCLHPFTAHIPNSNKGEFE